jgi:GT2 family glycosyltransferase/tetratricopeptide (TPR) repeat protein
MARHYLFGPVSASFGEQQLLRQRQTGECLIFDESGTADVAIDPHDTWESVCGRLPNGWRPDLVVINLSYTTIPPCLWSAPVPLVGLAGDWNLLWHWYRRCARACDLVLTDAAGVEVFSREGIANARPAILYGCERRMLETPEPNGVRDIDILFVGNLHPAVQRERLPWLGRLARVAGHRRVAIHTGVFGDEYCGLLRRARIVFNRSIRGECNRRAFEAAAGGALLFQEAGNLEARQCFQDGRECVYYREDNLEELLEYYLDHEEDRRAIAEAGRSKVAEHSYEKLWEQQMALIENEWAELTERARRRQGEPDLLGRVWQVMNRGGGDTGLSTDIASALVRAPRSGTLHNALGLILHTAGRGAHEVADYFARAMNRDPGHVLARLNWAEALAADGKKEEAIEQVQRTLEHLEANGALRADVLDAGHFPLRFDYFRVEWERAAWQNAGRPDAETLAKANLLRWRLHSLLGDLTGDQTHYYESVLARPDLPGTQAALGCALANNGQFGQAVAHLRQGVGDNPFDLQAAQALFQALGAAGDGIGQRRLADDRRLLAKAAPQIVPAEPWIERVPPTGGELASIIVLCCNQVDYTKRCLESVFSHTDSPFELIVVDNGSTDDTATYLQEIRTRKTACRTVVIRNETNRGFAAGCNQALAQSRGGYLVFLNNDTVVTDGWLSGLVGWSLHDWPQVGLVGPVSNYAPPPQHVVGDYRELAGLDSFARRHRQQLAGKALTVERLTGFCLLVRREVIERIGGFDEGFGLGFFEDDDLCVRAREAGFKLLVAQDVFIHHFGSRTFSGLGVDSRKELEKNFGRFRAKWGDERAAGYRMQGQEGEPRAPSSPLLFPEAGARGDPARPAGKYFGRVSLCMIVKNEEVNLPSCLLSTADLVDEAIVVDTGSTDETKTVAAKHGAHVHDFVWVDDFAAARNESLRHANGDWIFWMDGDDRVDDENRAKLRALFATLKDENVAYVMKCRCMPDPETGTATVVDHVRLFRNRPDVRWQYRVHEQILPGVRRVGGEVRTTDIVIQHVGYLDAGLRGRKQERDVRLLELDLAQHPDDPFILFNLGWSYEELRKPAEALPLLRRSLALSHPADSIVRKAYTLVMECHRQLGQPEEALTVCQEGRRYYPDDAQLLFQEALLCRELGDPAGAEGCFLRLLETNEGPHFASVAEGLRGHKARHNLAIVYHEQGRLAEAEAQWKAALDEQQSFTPSWLGLGELYLAQARFRELDLVIAQLEGRASGNGDAVAVSALRARRHIALKEFSAARNILEEAIDLKPGATYLWIVLSHALLQEGKDWERAEEALRTVLQLDPGNAEARNNLAILLAHASTPSLAQAPIEA